MKGWIKIRVPEGDCQFDTMEMIREQAPEGAWVLDDKGDIALEGDMIHGTHNGCGCCSDYVLDGKIVAYYPVEKPKLPEWWNLRVKR